MKRSNDRILTKLSGPVSFLLVLLVGTVAVVLASSGEGGHGGSHFEPILSRAMLWRIVNFVILFGLLYKFMAKPVRDFFGNRREQILTSLEEAKRSKEEAEARYQELSGKLANRDQEFEEIRRSALENAEKAKNQIIAEAQEKARRLEEKAKESIQQELKKAQEALKEEAAELALKLSEEKLSKEITPADHKRFMDEYIAGLK